LPWIYLPFLCKDLKSLFANAHAWNAKGFSITHPFKQEIIPYLGDATPEVEELQSCNTVARVNDQWIGTNTDVAGIRSLLEDVPLNGARAVILGAGASARTFASIIRPHVSSLSILARSPGKAKRLAEKFQAGSGSLQDLKKFDHNVLIQATPVGWQHDEMPVGAADLKSNTFVIDSIYRDTPLLRHARDLGCKTLNGEKWFYAQARAQFDWWKSLNL
jgi:3-dehydroquinate dehydratase/shikimate dehydrogenase